MCQKVGFFEIKKDGISRPSKVSYFRNLICDDCLDRANLGTSTAIRANIGIDLVDLFALGDGLDRAFGLARPAGYAFVCNSVRHESSLKFVNSRENPA